MSGRVARVIDLDAAWVGEDVWTLRPDYAACLVTAAGIAGGPSDAASDAALAGAEDRARTLAAAGPIEAHPRLAAWREAFRAFGVRPRSAVSSVESLVRRAADGLPRIDRLTDHYNAISVAHLVPFGGEDLDRYAGPPRLVRATGTERFDAIEGGAVVDSAPKPGEVVWRDDAGVTCRRWNWRQCARTRLTPQTRNAFYVIDGLGPTAAEDVRAAGTDLIALLRAVSPDADVRTRLITRP